MSFRFWIGCFYLFAGGLSVGLMLVPVGLSPFFLGFQASALTVLGIGKLMRCCSEPAPAPDGGGAS